MTIEYVLYDLVPALFGIVTGLILLWRTVLFIRVGSIEWYQGEQFKICKSEAPGAFWVMIIINMSICAVFIFGGIRWLL